MAEPIGTPTAVADAIHTAIGEVAIEPPERLERGYGNESWLVATSEGRRLLKIAVRWPGGERQRNAAEGARMAQRAGVTTPQALALVESGFDGRGFGVWEYLDGRDAADALDSLETLLRDQWFEGLGAMLARLHAPPAPYFAGSLLDDEGADFEAVMAERLGRVISRFEAAGIDPGHEVVAALDCLGDLVEECAPSARPALVHNDIYLDNLVVGPEGDVVLLDFEHARYLDAVQDFVKPTLFIEHRFPGAVAAMRAGYEGGTAPAPQFEQRLRLAMGLELVWGLPFFQQWNDHAVVALYRAELTQWLERR